MRTVHVKTIIFGSNLNIRVKSKFILNYKVYILLNSIINYIEDFSLTHFYIYINHTFFHQFVYDGFNMCTNASNQIRYQYLFVFRLAKTARLI